MQTDAPRKPTSLAEWIYDYGPVTEIRIEYRMSGVDTSETYCHLTGWHCGNAKPKTRECRPDAVREVADLSIGYNSILELKPGISSMMDAWRKYQKSNAREISEYARLKAKFGGDGD